MAPLSFDFSRGQRWCILASIVLTASVIWPAAMDSTVVKMPVFVLSATFATGLLLSANLLSRRSEVRFGIPGFILLAHLLLFLLSAWMNFNPVYTWNAFLFEASCILVLWVTSRSYASREDLTSLLRGISWLTACLCLVGVLQYFDAGLLPFVFALGPERRVASLLGSSETFGSYLVIVIPLLLAMALVVRRSVRALVIYICLLGVAFLLLLLTQTRSSIAGFFVSIALFVLLTVRGRKGATILLIAALVLAGLAGLGTLVRPDLGARFSQMFSGGPKSSFARRLYFWQAGRDAFLGSPVIGYGTGSFERAVFYYRSPDYWMVSSEDIVPHAHNEIIEIGVEYGAVGLLLSFVTAGLVFHRGLTRARTGTEWQKWLAAGIISAIAGIAVDNLANVTLRRSPIALLAWVLMGLLFSPAFSVPPYKAVRLPFRLPAWTVAIPWLLWGLLTFLFGRAQLKAVSADVHMADAMMSRGRHDAPAALGGYKAAVNADPHNLMARWYLAQGYLDGFQWENALRSVTELQQLSPRYPQSSLMKAMALYRLQRYPESLESIEKELGQRSHPFSYLVQASTFRALSDELREREAIVRLLRKVIESGQPFAYHNSCQRLVEITRSEDQVNENLGLFNSLEAIFPQEHDFFASLKKAN
jgi:O-antigen ligase